MYHPLRDQGIDPNEFPESEVMTIDVLPKWAYTNHPVKLTYDRKEDPNVPLSVVRSKEIEAINEYLASITAGLAAANARIAELEAQLAAAISHPVPTAQEMLIAILQHVGVAVGHGDEADFRAAVMAVAAEMGLNIDEEQGDA